MAFVLDVNLRIKEILNLQKVEAALSKIKGTVHAGVAGGIAAGGVGGIAAVSKAQAIAANANAIAINKVTVANNKLATSQRKTVGTTKKAAASMKAAGRSADSFGKSVGIAAKRYGAFLAATIVPFAALAGISKATASVIEFNSAMLKMRQITGQTEPQIAEIRDTILNLSVSTGTSAKQLADVGKILVQAGQRGDELRESLTQLAKVPLTPSFDSIGTAVEGLIAITRQFRKEMLDTAEVFDVVTALSNKFAASAEDIFTGFTRGGAAFEAIGGTFREFASVFTTIRQATRESAATVGTFMKTISSRLADPKIVGFLEGKGIRISESIEAGDPVGALKTIAFALERIVGVQDNIEIGVRLGGRRQISRLLALVSNIDILQETLKTANMSAGEFGKIAEVGLQGLQAQLNILTQEFNKLVQTLAKPLFVPIIRGVVSVGKAFVSFIDIIKPVIPALVAIVGLAAGFKLLAISIGAAGKALAFMSTVGVGGGAPGIFRAFAGAGGVASATAKERIKRRLTGAAGVSVGGAAATATGVAVGSRVLGGLKSAATAPLGQLAGAAALILAADKLSSSFEKTGNSSGILAAEFVKSAVIILAGVSLVSGKSISVAIRSIIGSLGPWGAAIAAGVTALTAFTFAAKKAVDFDIQKLIDAASEKVKKIEVPRDKKGQVLPIAADDQAGLEKIIGDLGVAALVDGVQGAINRFNEGFSGALARGVSRLSNFVSGEGFVAISDTDARQMIKTIIGNNPEVLNEIIRSSVEQFGLGIPLTSGIDKLLASRVRGAPEAISQLTKAIIAEVGGIEKITDIVKQSNASKEIRALAMASRQAAANFNSLTIPIQLTGQLSFFSRAVAKTTADISRSSKLFKSQIDEIEGGIVAPSLSFDFTSKQIQNLIGGGGLKDLFDFSPNIPEFVSGIKQMESLLDEFINNINNFPAQVNLTEKIDKFISSGKDIPDVVRNNFETFFQSISRDLVAASLGNIIETDTIKKRFEEQFSNFGLAARDAITQNVGEFLNTTFSQVQDQLERLATIRKFELEAPVRPSTQASFLEAQLRRSGVDIGSKVRPDNVMRGTLEELQLIRKERAARGSSRAIQGFLPIPQKGFFQGNAQRLADIAGDETIRRQVRESFKSVIIESSNLKKKLSELQPGAQGFINATKRLAALSSTTIELQTTLAALDQATQKALVSEQQTLQLRQQFERQQLQTTVSERIRTGISTPIKGERTIFNLEKQQARQRAELQNKFDTIIEKDNILRSDLAVRISENTKTQGEVVQAFDLSVGVFRDSTQIQVTTADLMRQHINSFGMAVADFTGMKVFAQPAIDSNIPRISPEQMGAGLATPQQGFDELNRLINTGNSSREDMVAILEAIYNRQEQLEQAPLQSSSSKQISDKSITNDDSVSELTDSLNNLRDVLDTPNELKLVTDQRISLDISSLPSDISNEIRPLLEHAVIVAAKTITRKALESLAAKTESETSIAITDTVQELLT